MKVRKEVKVRPGWIMKFVAGVLGICAGGYLMSNGLYERDPIQGLAGVAVHFGSLLLLWYVFTRPSDEVIKVVRVLEEE